MVGRQSYLPFVYLNGIQVSGKARDEAAGSIVLGEDVSSSLSGSLGFSSRAMLCLVGGWELKYVM